jgi:uncharacterized protein YndB with AHSA1/START domain
VDLDARPIGGEGGQLASECDRFRDCEVHIERSAIVPTLDEHQTVSVVDVVVDIMTDASGLATRAFDVLATQGPDRPRCSVVRTAGWPASRFVESRGGDVESTPVGKTKDAGWQIGVSRTVPAALDDVWRHLVSPRGLAIWLGEGVDTPLEVGRSYRTTDGTHGEIRSLRPRDRVRLTWQPVDRPDAATVQVAVTPASTGCTIRFHTERLDDAGERERMRSHWRAIADALEAEFQDGGTGSSARCE